MPSEDSQQGDMSYISSSKSLCSTAFSFRPFYQDTFFLGSEQRQENLSTIQIHNSTLYIESKGQNFTIPLLLAVLEEQLYFRDERLVYAVKITQNGRQKLHWNLSTFDKDKFTELYLKLAKFCILTNFQRHYRVGKQLGNGTFGTVYDGFNVLTNENVALKVISKRKMQQTLNGIEMVYNEIKSLQKLQSHLVSPLISVYQTTDCFILVEEKGQGGNLFEYIQTHSSCYGQPMLKSIFKQLLQIMSVVHQEGIIHRDIKPENIMVKNDSSNPSIFLVDYSISVQKNQGHIMCGSSSQVSGTMGYIAPEIVHEKDFNEKSDIFSIGCMMYYLFTGQKLFETRSFHELKEMTEDDEYLKRRLQRLKGNNMWLVKLIQTMVEIEPQKRPSASEGLRSPFFKGTERFLPNCSESDDTLKEFLDRKVQKYLRIY